MLSRFGAFLQVVLAVASVGAAVADIRPLTEEEEQSVLREVRSARIASAYAQTQEERTVLRYATVYYPPTPFGDGDCVAWTFDLMAEGGSLAWKPEFQSAGYFYWPRTDCARADWTESILLGSIDSDSLSRILENAPGILRESASRLRREDGPNVTLGNSARISSIDTVRDDNRFIFAVQFQVSECVGVRAHVRLLENVEVVSAVDTYCETREYRGLPAGMPAHRGSLVSLRSP
jgi:hypothetical protein